MSEHERRVRSEQSAECGSGERGGGRENGRVRAPPSPGRPSRRLRPLRLRLLHPPPHLLRPPRLRPRRHPPHAPDDNDAAADDDDYRLPRPRSKPRSRYRCRSRSAASLHDLAPFLPEPDRRRSCLPEGRLLLLFAVYSNPS